MNPESDFEKRKLNDLAFLKRKVQELGEHFDTVQIFVARNEVGASPITADYGLGPESARYGMVLVWAKRFEAAVQAEAAMQMHRKIQEGGE